MNQENDSSRHLQQIRQSPIFRWARALQWFGLVMFFLAAGLCTDLYHQISRIPLIAVLGILGLLSLVPARFI